MQIFDFQLVFSHIIAQRQTIEEQSLIGLIHESVILHGCNSMDRHEKSLRYFQKHILLKKLRKHKCCLFEIGAFPLIFG